RHAECAKGVTERGSLRNRRHRHPPERNTDDGAEHKRNGDQPVVHNAVVQQRAADRQQHANFARPDAVSGRGRRAHPLQREDEQHARDEIYKLDDDLTSCEFGCHYLAAGLAAGRLVLNIFNMRSVMRKPPTMLLVAATTAMNPKTAASVLLCSPTSTIAPTTAIASKALVSDINGVCSRGETRRITSNPMNPASTKIKSALIRFELLFIFPPSDFPGSWRAGRPRPAGPFDFPLGSARGFGKTGQARETHFPPPYEPSTGHGRQCGQSKKLANPGIHNLATVGEQSFANDFIPDVQIQLLIFDQVSQERSDVAGVHHARVIRHAGGQVDGSDNGHTVFYDGLAAFGDLAVAATF